MNADIKALTQCLTKDGNDPLAWAALADAMEESSHPLANQMRVYATVLARAVTDEKTSA